MLRTCVMLTLAAGLATAAAAQNRTGCDQIGDSDRANFCEVREMTIGASNPIEVDAGKNGGIRIHGWDRGDALVRARIVAYGDTQADAQRAAQSIRIDASGSVVRADGPSNDDRTGWSVSFEISVPRTAMLTLKANNGGISIDDFRGTAKFETHNGGISLRNVGGDLHGETTNGGVTVEASGDHWDGTGLDVTTRNGGVNVRLPEHYSAELEVGTEHGSPSREPSAGL